MCKYRVNFGVGLPSWFDTFKTCIFFGSFAWESCTLIPAIFTVVGAAFALPMGKWVISPLPNIWVKWSCHPEKKPHSAHYALLLKFCAASMVLATYQIVQCLQMLVDDAGVQTCVVLLLSCFFFVCVKFHKSCACLFFAANTLLNELAKWLLCSATAWFFRLWIAFQF